MKKYLLLSLLFLLFISLSAEFKKSVGIIIVNNKNTVFKKALIDSLINTNSEIEFHVVELKKLKDLKKYNYDAMIVFDQLEAWTFFNRKLKTLCKKLDPKKTIYYVTAGDPDWNWNKTGIITITSASKLDKIDEAKNKINNQLHKILKI